MSQFSLSTAGSNTHGLLRNLLAPVAPKDKTLQEIVKVLKGHFEYHRRKIPFSPPESSTRGNCHDVRSGAATFGH